MSTGRGNPIISGSGMAVLLGFGSILGAFLLPEITMGSRLLLFLAGVVVLVLGLLFSNG